jgi:undecaprenyl-diphosphatase
MLGWCGRHTPGRSVRIATAVTMLGETPVVWAAVAASACLAGARTGSQRAVVAPLCALAAAAGLRRALAELIDRPRPPQRLWRTAWTGPSFPSRHTTLATIGAGLAAEALTDNRRRSALGTGVVAGAVGVSRLVLGVHWPTDVLAGWVFAAAVLSISRRIGLTRPKAGFTPKEDTR